MAEVGTKLLEESIGKIVLIRLKGGRSIRGKLQGFDQHMNLTLDEADDVSDINNVVKLGIIIVRGDNVIIVSPSIR